jgi:RNA polymerase sigma-70 factor (ECF subfamily)
MATCWEVGRAAWPQVEVPPAELARYLAARGVDEPSAHAADLYLACACALAIPAALRLLEQRVLSQAPQWVRRFDSSPTFAADLSSLLREKLLVSTPERPAKISEYSGRGPFAAWVRMVAVRTAIDLVRSTSGRALGQIELPSRLAAQADDPELQYLKQRYQPLFKAAIAEGLTTLDSEQRSLLRLRLLDGLSYDQIAALLGSSKATVARRMNAVREQILARVKQELQAGLGVDTAEFHSLVGVVHSQLEISIESHLRLLQTAGG